MPEIIVTKYSGYCPSVERAINIAIETAEKAQNVYTYGAIAHNHSVTDRLGAYGIKVADSLESLSRGDTLVISAHGACPELYGACKARGINVVDATCPNVKNIHKLVQEYSEQGYCILLAGDKNHKEVRGICGYGKNVIVINECPKELPNGFDKYMLSAQTTFDKESFDKIAENLQFLARNSKKTLVIFNTICYTTIRRQAEARELSAFADAVFVVGDAQSANTRRLASIASARCEQVYLISEAAELDSVANIKNITKPCVLAGASTPKESVMEVINKMDQTINPVDLAQENEIKTETEEVITNDAATEEVKTEEVKAPVKADKKSGEITSMEEALKSGYAPKSYREGMTVKATIQSIEPTGVTVYVNLNGKNDSGFISAEEMELDGSYDPGKYAIGDNLQAIIIPKGDSKNKAINLSKKKYDELLVADEAVKAIKEGEEFTLTIAQAIKGGLLGKIGSYTIFVPASQIRIGYVKNLEEYVGKKLRLRMLPPKEDAAEDGEEKRRPNPKRIVASQRIILEEERAAKEEAFWDAMQVNNVVEGKVKRFAMKDGKYFGVFVSIMNKDCLLHISDLSWTKVDDPSTILELNKKYEFVVLKADRENDKVSLGYKQLQKQPYELAAEKYHVGDVIKGKVERIKDFGAFISIEPGIDGLVHVSEISHKWIANAAEALKVGDEVEAKIVSFEKNKITLSIKALLDPPVVEEHTEEATDAEDGNKTNSRVARFNKRATQADDKRSERKPRREAKVEDDEPHEYISSTTGTTMADLFKGFDLDKFKDSDEGDK